MLQPSDLKAAADEGIISAEQAIQLEAFAHKLASGQGGRMSFVQDVRDEPFRLLRGFRDVFIALGVLIFSFGATGVAFLALPGTDAPSGVRPFLTSAGLSEAIVTILLLALGFALAEWITRRQRLPLASLMLSLMIAFWSALLFLIPVGLPETSGSVATPAERAPFYLMAALGAVLGLVVFYWRYRLPFALLPLAGAAVVTIFAAAQGLFPGNAAIAFERPLIGALGVGVFAAAMWFDIKDRLRVSRFSECAFWLHLLAAPMMVHALLGIGEDASISQSVLLMLAVAALAAIAIVIDRRALLVSGLSYFAIAIAQVISTSGVSGGVQFAITTLVLGGVVLALGLGWTPVRRVIVGALPKGWLTERIPPIAA